jgi:hypothetical protein
MIDRASADYGHIAAAFSFAYAFGYPMPFQACFPPPQPPHLLSIKSGQGQSKVRTAAWVAVTVKNSTAARAKSPAAADGEPTNH